MSMRNVFIVLSFVMMPSFAVAADAPPKLDYDMLVKYYFSQKQDLAAKEGMGFDYALWQNCAAAKKDAHGPDEFAKRKQQKEFSEWVQSLPADTKLPTRVTVSMNGTFGHYDFEKQVFAFDPIDNSTVVAIKKERGRIIYKCDPLTDAWPAVFNVSFSNGNAFNGIPMTEAEAAKINTNKGRKTRIDMTINIDGVQLDRAAQGKAAPAVKATVVDMNVTQVDRGGRDAAQMAYWDEEAVKKMTADLKEDTEGAPMPANGESFALWADNLKDVGLAKKYGIDGTGIALKSIGMPVRSVGLDYPTDRGAVPRDLRDEGTVFVKPVWLRLGTTPKEIELESDIGSVAIQFSNQAEFDAKQHKISTDLLQLLLQADRGVAWEAEIVFTPLVYFEEETNMGTKRHVFRSHIERMIYTARPLMGKETASTVFTEDTLVGGQ